MTVVAEPPAPAAPPPASPPPVTGPGRGRAAIETTVRWAVALFGALVIFSVLLLTQDVDPLQAYADIWTSTFANGDSLQAILVKMSPFVLAALAVVVPAKAGMVNVGGEGQVVMGAVAACGTALWLDNTFDGSIGIWLMLLASAAAGAIWAGIAAAMRLLVSVNEAISTLLLNYVAIYFLLFLVYQPWKDAAGGGQPASRPLYEDWMLPLFSADIQVHIGLIVAVVAVIAVWAVLKFTTWGFRLSVVGGNSEAARRSGLPVGKLLLSAMLVGGALAGIAGWMHFAGVEYQLRPGFGANIGYIGFLASWLARHKPVPVLIASFAFAAITVAGDSLQLDSGLPAASVNILTGLILVAVLGWTQKKVKA